VFTGDLTLSHGLPQFAFFKNDVLANFRVVLFELKLFCHTLAAATGGGVKISSVCGRDQFDFVAFAFSSHFFNPQKV
jgi:hypothetical protein